MMANKSQQLAFSMQPGPRERHLQRKFNNPLFNDNSINQQNVQAAQQQDRVAMQLFMEQFRELVQRAVKLDKNVESDVVLLLKAQLEQQYAVCTGLVGKPLEIQEALKKLINAISATLRSASKDDPHAMEKLGDDEAHTLLHFHLCGYMIVSDILNPDIIISETEQIPSLLNESQEVLQVVLAIFPPERIKVMVAQGKDLLKKIEAAGHGLPVAWQRITQMESWLESN